MMKVPHRHQFGTKKGRLHTKGECQAGYISCKKRRAALERCTPQNGILQKGSYTRLVHSKKTKYFKKEADNKRAAHDGCAFRLTKTNTTKGDFGAQLFRFLSPGWREAYTSDLLNSEWSAQTFFERNENFRLCVALQPPQNALVDRLQATRHLLTM